MSATPGLRSGLLALMVAWTAGTPSRAQQFSAELTRTQDGVTTAAGHLRVSGDKVRLDSPDFPDAFFLIDGSKPAAYLVRPAPGVFMDARQSTALVRLFVPVDPDNPCRQWQAMAQVAGLADQGDWHCEPAPAETIGARETMVYRATPASGRPFVGWIDRVHRFPLRIRTDDGASITAESIRNEQQASGLFELPKGARKFDPQALIELVKQSDVWVAAPGSAP
ncbi:hypothetical protein [Bradyrhizobium sp. Tv2a-2]|uniref:hypothetical protein n=1 Tax=Bradyrhizobium sp. Tv2a-2 TaxID=113395 RepID=UPI0018DB8084|nr:hypothetical protein [Bradyrhizobium sp. Tv2a-2]